MAHSNSSYTPWDRLYDAISAADSLAQIFSTFETKSHHDVECFVSVFGYVGSSLVDARDRYLEHLSIAGHKPMAVPVDALGADYVSGPVLEASNA